ncbi:MAG: polysaccharide pyruvyl transferase family protein [Pseudobutyrivibrio ruminis]|uniref:Polysaccharide pyruvyl transferase family protein n=1 Tax=Pseudobutyrivibrio ruminis TaxID=46206 RepID=A0A927UB11_9FIRM|nr:polysaccharide pyruvyl transferase family protein [Pseudobutyrivibrio ruminis]
MRIGIMTFHASHNCGSMLQAYALQHTLKEKYNADVELIDFANAGSRNMYSMIDLRLKKDAIKNNINNIRYRKVLKQYHAEYEDFKNKYLITSKKSYHSVNELVGVEKDYDLLISGGDQVWNVRCPDADEAYYLSFAKNVRKVSYSPSLGGVNINEAGVDLDKYREYLADYEQVSVREPNGQKWLKELTGNEYKIVADPVFLLSQEDWTEQFELPEIGEKFIFNYAFFHNRVDANTAMQKISQETGMPVYVMDTKSWTLYHLDQYGIKKYGHTGPIAFLTLMKNAELVLTQSFHGTVFSALFHKTFWSYRNPYAGKKPSDDRATAILEQLGLLDRYVVIDELPSMDYMKKIDYSSTDGKIEKLREDAFAYIDSFMN